MELVIALGGSVVNPTAGELNIAPYAAAIERITETGHNVSVVVGGGATARTYIGATHEFQASESSLDRIGIAASRLNARVLCEAIDSVYSPVLRDDPSEYSVGTLDVFGGTVPGHTTDAVAGLVAEEAQAGTVVYVTNVDGVYSSDPSENEDASRYDEIDYEELAQLIAEESRGAGSPAPIDLLAVKILQRSGLKAIIMKGDGGESLRQLVVNDVFDGTVVRDS